MKQPNNLRILAVDPSGTGTSGVYLHRDKWEDKFFQFTSQEWLEHFKFILDLVEEYQPELLLFENTNFISLRGKDMTSLLKLLGAIEVLPSFWAGLQTRAIPVNQVKGLRSKLLKRSQRIEGIEYRKGIGWHYLKQKISVHGLDAYLVYWLAIGKSIEKEPPKPSLLGKVLKLNKVKQKTSKNTKRTEPDWNDFEEPGLECPGLLCFECDSPSCICWMKEEIKQEDTKEQKDQEPEEPIEEPENHD